MPEGKCHPVVVLEQRAQRIAELRSHGSTGSMCLLWGHVVLTPPTMDARLAFANNSFNYMPSPVVIWPAQSLFSVPDAGTPGHNSGIHVLCVLQPRQHCAAKPEQFCCNKE
eukprot:320799-Pelagomonas_calceolata.AAC.1